MSGIIGQPMSVLQVEAVGNIHQSHSYVRGNWHSEKETTPMLLAKSCHDIDMIQWLLEKPCKSVQSFGDLTYFTEKNAPEGAPVRCIDGGCPIEDTCPYNCRKLYYESKHYSMRLACTLGIAKEETPTDEEVMLGLQTKDYGLCVFHANNDVVDHQVVNMEFEGGVTASFTMNAFNFGGRYIRIFGTQGELYAKVSDSKITVYNFVEKAHKEIPVVETDESINGGHGGGDEGIINELYDYLNGDYKGFRAADIETSVRNHLIVFAAEKSRHNKTVEDMDAFMESHGMSNN
jgi:predicted dehydrogenase